MFRFRREIPVASAESSRRAAATTPERSCPLALLAYNYIGCSPPTVTLDELNALCFQNSRTLRVEHSICGIGRVGD